MLKCYLSMTGMKNTISHLRNDRLRDNAKSKLPTINSYCLTSSFVNLRV
ncbi:hypothetical protein CFT9_21868 [Pseudomonas sp. CFT9]|nr:hypothetical protein CFT9_21868 [Pseudomonas sp. CFT9]EPL09670.1 hypothetical protein CF150_17918 [Pseudomonas sp. CF150]